MDAGEEEEHEVKRAELLLGAVRGILSERGINVAALARYICFAPVPAPKDGVGPKGTRDDEREDRYN